MSFVPSAYQRAIFDWIVNGRGDAVIEAVAGSGKTSTVVECAKLIKSDKVTFIAFNKHIVKELQDRLDKSIKVKTIHSIGYAAISRHMGKVEIDDKKYRDLIRPFASQIAEDLEREYNYKIKEWQRSNKDDKRPVEPPTASQISAQIENLIHYCKVTLTPPEHLSLLEEMVAHFNCLEDGLSLQQLQYPLQVVMRQGEEISIRDKLITFDDMIYLPYKWNLEPPKQDWLLVDECLPYKTPVLLADGTSMQIGDIVEQKLPVSVLAYDTATGTQKPCLVSGWSKTPNRKPLVKIKVKHYRPSPHGSQKTTNFVVCTVDHKVWADGKWIEAGDVKSGMTVQVETSAAKTQAYKITTPGRSVVSATMTAKNATLQDKRSTGGVIKSRGGNGQGLTIPQQMMLDALGSDWIAEYAIPTKVKKGNGYPTCYKVDLANPQFRIAVELDGESHRSIARQQQDEKKEHFLATLGWKVVRIPNTKAVQQIDDWVGMLNFLTKYEANVGEDTRESIASGDPSPDSLHRPPASCDDGNCPVDAKVVSVEPVSISDYYVYDITVEDCHNFYANGILVHNCQDMNAAQLDLILKMRSRGGRTIWVGDRKQSIYGFTGADCNSIDNIIARTNATVLPLSICYRCPKSHVQLAQKVVPHIEASPTAKPGEIKRIFRDEIVEAIQEGDLVICRTTAPAINLCIELIASKIPAKVRGRDIGQALTAIVRDVAKADGFTFAQFGNFLQAYQREKVAKMVQKGNNQSQVESFCDRVSGIWVCYQSFNVKTINELCFEIEQLFSDGRSSVMLSTIHKAKGLENGRVLILRPDLLPLRWKNQQAWELEQEKNLLYVALTRAKNTLIFIDEKEAPPKKKSTDESIWDAEFVDEEESKPLALPGGVLMLQPSASDTIYF